jgi:Pentapeptide repeats (8 copies)
MPETVASAPHMAELDHHLPGRRRLPAAGWALLALAVAVVLVGVVLVGPRLLYPPLSDRELDRQGVTGGRDRIELQREQGRLQNDARATLLQALAGGALLLGAYLTWRQVQTGRQQVHLAEQGQITERFTRAIDQLGSEHLDVRLGGIYALERIARDSPGDRSTIGEVLTAYIRGHAPWPPRRDGQPPADAAIEEVAFLRLRAPDVQAALTVLGRGRFAAPDPEAPRLDLSDTDLRRAYLSRADLRGARLYGAALRKARLEDTDLRGATLTRANLQEAHLVAADLQDAGLRDADLQDADLTGANLGGADLRYANLQGTKLDGADLPGRPAPE